MAKRILLVEDEPGLQVTLSDRLRSEGYEVETVSDGETGYERATEETFDLIILDIMLPGKNGFDVCRDLRQDGMTQPILMLTARDQVADKVVGLKLGGDDYLTKPFENIELLARVEALLRRSATSVTRHSTDFYEFGNISVDFRKSEVILSGMDNSSGGGSSVVYA